MADIAADIKATRKYGVVHCGVSAHPLPSLVELAAEFGLAPNLASYKEIDSASARRLAELILSQDLAYHAGIMPTILAAELTDRFLAQFGTDGVSFYTNGTFHEAPGQKLKRAGNSWEPVTEATFDTGILVLGPRCSGCLWVEDED